MNFDVEAVKKDPVEEPLRHYLPTRSERQLLAKLNASLGYSGGFLLQPANVGC